MVSLKVNFKKKDLWLVAAIVVFIVGVGYVIASYPYSQAIPNPGHGSDTVWVDVNGEEMTLQEAITNGKLGGGSCSLGNWVDVTAAAAGGAAQGPAQTDGFLIAIGSAVGTGDAQSIFTIYSDSNNPPTTTRYRFIQQLSGNGRNIAPTGVIPVKKGDYFRVTYTYVGNNQPITAIYWIPLNCGGSGGGASCMWYDFVQYVTNAEFEANGGTGICRWTRSSVWYYGSMMAYGGGINEQIGCVVPGVIWMGNEAGQYYGCK